MRLIDDFGRVHTNLRISVTDRCNLRCFYCMPAENVQFKPRDELLTYEEITRFVRVLAPLGIEKIRLTGGEPLVRQNVADLVRMLAVVPGIRDLALTTNGILLAEQAAELKAAGLRRLNVSLDALDAELFQQISRRAGLDRVLEGIRTARAVGFKWLRLNAVSIRGLTETQIVPLARFARDQELELRFIEYMPLDADGAWSTEQVLSGDEVRQIIDRDVAELVPVASDDPSQPATEFRYRDRIHGSVVAGSGSAGSGGRVGFINSVTQPFCGRCNRLRLTAEGQVRNCLFSTTEWDARALLRGDGAGRGTDEQIAALVAAAVGAKKFGHGIDTPDFVKPQRAMYQIGG